jgi:hypothetical protein
MYTGAKEGSFKKEFDSKDLRAAMREHADSLKPNSPHAYAWRLRTVMPELF